MASSQEKQTQDAASAAAALGQGPPPAEVAQAIEAAKTAASFQDAADALRKQASLAWDPVEREKLLKSAYLKEKAAHGESKKARVMASGWGQGAGLGVGVSAAVGMGAGNLIGALLSGVVAVPGALIGSGVGAIHGPFVKLKDLVTGNEKKADDTEIAVDEKKLSAELDEGVTDTEEDIKAHAAIVEAARSIGDDDDDDKADEGRGGREDAHDGADMATQEHGNGRTTEQEPPTSGPSTPLAEAERESGSPKGGAEENHYNPKEEGRAPAIMT